MPRLDRDGVTLHYYDEGAGEPVVLIHAFPFSADLWMPQRAALAGACRVIAPDVRGFGGSDPLFSTPSVDAFADDIVVILDELGIGQATVVGISMGGYITMALLRRHPERVRAIVLVSTKATADTPAAKEARNDLIALVEREGAGAVADKMVPNMLTERTRRDDADLTSSVHTMMASCSAEGIAGGAAALRDRPDSVATLASARVPTLIVVGADDKVTTVEDAQRMKDAIGDDADLRIVPDAAHLLNLEQPAAFNDILLRFVDRLTTT